MSIYIDTDNKILGFDDSQADLIPSGAVEIPSTYTPNQYPYITLVSGAIKYNKSAYDAAVNAKQLADCKAKAQNLLNATDWSTLNDVTTGTPRLSNQSEFIAYRSQLRTLALYPVANPEWPTAPTEAWE